MNFEKFISEQDELIKSGQGIKVRGHLKELSKREKVPRQYRGQVAKIARRVGFENYCLRLLHGIVYPTQKNSEPATAFENLQYASALLAIGATVEARELLQKIPSSAEPEALLYQGISFFSEWDYKSSLPYLDQFVSQKSITEYQKCIGLLNYASALVTTHDWPNADKILNTLLDQTSKNQFILLNAHALEVKSEMLLWRQEYKECLQSLQSAAKSLTNAGVDGENWVRKWKAVCLAFSGRKREAVRLIQSSRELAIKLNDWETQRESDLFESCFTKNKSQFYRVYFGTHFSSYRSRALEIYSLMNGHLDPARCESITVNSDLHTEKNICDFQSLNINGEPMAIKVGSSDHKLLRLLSSDLYRPVRIAQINYIIFDQAYFNPFTTPHRVQELVRRFKRRIGTEWIRVQAIQSGYRLNFDKPLKLRLQTEVPRNENINQPSLHREHIQQHFQNHEFTTFDLKKLLKCSQRTAQRIVHELLAQDCLKIRQHGRTPHYQLK